VLPPEQAQFAVHEQTLLRFLTGKQTSLAFHSVEQSLLDKVLVEQVFLVMDKPQESFAQVVANKNSLL
jgi:hypothetical protein